MRKPKPRIVASTRNGCWKLFICPTIYQTESGAFIVQGSKVDRATKSQLGVPSCEDAVEIPRELLLRALQTMKRTR